MKFDELNVKDAVVKALKEDGIVEATTIQEKSIPLVHNGHDVVGISRTGSGKTASFGIPLLEKMEPGQGVQSLVLAPTRELAVQISKELQKWGKYLDLNFATVFGGVGIDPQIQDIKKAEVVVGTPGRILDHIGRRTLDLTKLKMFVLDEADKMVEMGFIEDIERILGETNKERQIMLFGATISKEIDYLKETHMHNVEFAEAELHVKKDLLEQYYYNIAHNQKFSLLVHLLKKDLSSRVMIFCSKRSTVELVYKNLRNNGIKCEEIHGKMTQNRRLRAIEQFNEGKVNYLIASAVAARGLDIQGVTHVYNYDLSNDPQEYIHRVGRTARAGESGKAITLLSDQDHGNFHGIFDKYDVDIQELPLEKFERIPFEVNRDRDSGSRTGHSRDSQRRGQHRR